MTSNTPDLLEKIRAKVVESVPEVMELGFGCKILPKNISAFKWVDPGDSAVIVRVIDGGECARIAWNDTRISTEELSNFAIIGRPIQLADVLLAIGTSDKVYAFNVDVYGDDFTLQYDFPGSRGYAHWNLRKDSLEDQSPECITFISSILGVV